MEFKSKSMITKVRDMASTFGVSSTTCANWRRQPDFPGGLNGPWPKEAVQRWIDSDPKRSYSHAIKPRKLSDDEKERQWRSTPAIAPDALHQLVIRVGWDLVADVDVLEPPIEPELVNTIVGRVVEILAIRCNEFFPSGDWDCVRLDEAIKEIAARFAVTQDEADRKMVDKAKLAEEFGISESEVDEYVRRGMPVG